MALPNLVFSVASEYDGKGLSKARKDVNAFDKSVKSLGRTLGATLSAAAVVSFGKASVKAFLADDKAAATLTRTLGNLNLAFEDQRVRSYISSLEASSGVLDSQLRPAMQALLTTTGSVTKSQELLGLAIDVAAGSGENLVTVAQDISQAFVGNTRGLKKYNLGLTQAELQTATFADLQEKLNKQFSGQNAAQLDTYAGKLSLIKVAYDNLQETVGKGLVDSFAVLAGDTGIGSATKAIGDFGQAIADTVYGLALVVAEVRKLDASISGGTLGRLIAWSIKYSPAGILRDLGAAQRIKPQPFTTPMSISGQNTKNSLSAVEKMRAEAEAEALKRAKALAAAQKLQLANAKKLAAEAAKKLALDKASAFLNQANKLFDLDRIQLAAAAMAKQSEEDKVRIRLKTNILELEDAINEGNIQGAAKFAALITQDAALLGQLRDSAYNLSDVPNPFDAWLASLNAALAALIAMTKVIPIVTAMVGMGGFNAGSARMGESAGNTAAGLPANSLSDFMGFGDEHLGQLARQGGNATTINYNISASGIGDQAIASVVQNAIQELNRYGNSTTFAGAI
jgi:hypothetical protein